MNIEEKFASILPTWQARVTKLLRESGDVKVDEVTISQVYGGMRNVKSLVTDISFVDSNEGIRLRGYTIPELLDGLPKLPEQPASATTPQWQDAQARPQTHPRASSDHHRLDQRGRVE